MSSAWEEWKKSLGNTRPWDLLNPNENRASDEVQKERISLCYACPELIQLTKQCKKCGCLMELKTKIQNAVCPIGKW